MRMYSSQSTCVEVDWSGIKLNFIPFHFNICRLRWIHMHPNKVRYVGRIQKRGTYVTTYVRTCREDRRGPETLRESIQHISSN